MSTTSTWRLRSVRKGFSLLELLISIGIVSLLIAILLPAIAGVRSASRSALCLADLQQWGQSYQMYVSQNHGRSFRAVNGRDPQHREWWDVLAPYSGNIRRTFLCPEANDRPAGPFVGKLAKGAAHSAWLVNLRGETRSSYGFNSWLFATSAGFSPDYFQFPLRQADRIPLFGDCCTVRTSATSTDPVPTNLQIPAPPNIDSGVTEYCIDRHQMAVNFVFADGHGERVPLAELWNLKWSQTFVRKVVLIPAR